MFTGLIEATGVVQTIHKTEREWRLTIACDPELSRLAIGSSVAVSGVCLTVVENSANGFTVEVSTETIRHTRFHDLTAGEPVNLERALRIGGRLDGHLVQGHVDAVAEVDRVIPSGRATELWFRVTGEAGRYLVPKGSVAIEGVSLTVNRVEKAQRPKPSSARDPRPESSAITLFSVHIIPHTRQKTTLATVVPGRMVNLETDIIGRYVERLLQRDEWQQAPGTIDENFLRENGYV